MPARLEELYSAVKGAAQVLILTHNDPDPDAIASALALRHLLAAGPELESRIAYRGIVGRAENKALVRYLKQPLRQLAAGDLRDDVPIALVDTQPGAGNNALPRGRAPAIVFDHHPWRAETATAAFAEVRPEVGATSTILAGYLDEADLEVDPLLATALFYGIKADTLGLVRGAGPEDVAAYLRLQPRVDLEALVEIERAQVPAQYFRQLDAALHTARVYDGVVLSYLGAMQHPDTAAELADLFLRLKGAVWVVCMGTYKDDLIISVRTRQARGGAGNLVRAIVGDGATAGGHGLMAAGHVPLRSRNPDELAGELSRRVLELLHVPHGTEGTSMLADIT